MRTPTDLPFDGPDDNLQPKQNSTEHIELLFPSSLKIASPTCHWVHQGPLGNSRLANRREIANLTREADNDLENYVRLFQAYAIAHEGDRSSIVDVHGLPIPLGNKSPNLLFFGRSGSGKTQKGTLAAGFHAIRQGWSIVYVNIKGMKQTRILKKFAERFGRLDEVVVLSPSHPERSVGCTLMEGGEKLISCKEVAAACVSSAARNSRNGEGAWAYNQTEEWIQHSIHAVCLSLPPEERNLLAVRDVVLSGAYEEFSRAHPTNKVLKRFADSWRSGNQNTNTISSTIAESTAFIDDTPEFLSTDEFRFSRFADEGGILILEIDQADIANLRPLVTIILSRLQSSLQRKACESVSGKIPHKTVVIIDELMASGAIPGLAECLHTCREQNFSFVAGAQAIGQIAQIYGVHAEGVLDGFQSQIALGEGLDMPTAAHFSRRSGEATVAIPSFQEIATDEDVAQSGRNWQLISRPPLLPSDIYNASAHPQFGMPATVLLGDGTPMFQAYLTPAYEEGCVNRWMEEALREPLETDLRKTPLRSGSRIDNKQVHVFTDPTGWSSQQILDKVKDLRMRAGFKTADLVVRKWWEEFERMNHKKPTLVLRLLEELLYRKATIVEFFSAFNESGSTDIPTVLIYLDYVRSKSAADKRQS
jgi:type IV secretory pathway TraG/TraD family ATPase VirD4